MITRTLRLGKATPPPLPSTTPLPSTEKTAQHLSEIIQFPTVSYQNPQDTEWCHFDNQRAWLEETYPLVHKHLTRQTFAEHSLLYTWSPQGTKEPQGTNPVQNSGATKPILFMAHLDVVEPGKTEEWHHPPFSGAIADNQVWGRGALDIKFQVVTLLDTVEHLLQQGFTPNRTVYIAFGHNEEVLGDGAQSMAAWFRKQGITFELVHDEGGAATTGVVTMISGAQATVGVGEKGVAHIELRADKHGGHASMPPKKNSLNMIAQAVCKLEKSPLKPRLIPTIQETFTSCAGSMKLPLRLVMANLWLFKPILLRALTRSPETNALIRSTMTPVIAHAGASDNVIPPHSSVTYNVRMLPGDTCEKMVSYMRRVVGSNISVTLKHGVNPSPVSKTDTPTFSCFKETVQQVFPDAVVAPYLMVGGTDSRHFADLSDHVLRFSPYLLTKEELNTIHSENERASFANIERGLRFYMQLIENFCA